MTSDTLLKDQELQSKSEGIKLPLSMHTAFELDSNMKE